MINHGNAHSIIEANIRVGFNKTQSRWRDLNPRPLPYQGSALPLSYIGKKLSGRRGSNSRPSAWKADALSTELLPHKRAATARKPCPPFVFCGRGWIRTTEGINQQIYSLPHLATLEHALYGFQPPTVRRPDGAAGVIPFVVTFSLMSN